ncbi:MAG: AAA family ATPase [Bacteroidota bacterium]
MPAQEKISYWIFQSKPSHFRLRDALRTEALTAYPIRTHARSIKPGDKIILWQSGKEAACYGLATVQTPVGDWPVTENLQAFFDVPPASVNWVRLQVDYNLWNRPIAKELLKELPAFETFKGGRPGTNLKATAEEFEHMEQLIQSQDLVMEPDLPYLPNYRNQLPLNLILFGPPGTGKTYHSINYALSVIENRPLDELLLENRSQLRQRYIEYMEMGLIRFVTFHQSFSYEDFVEGIKPQSTKGQISYTIEDGIFKQICLDARRSMLETLFSLMPQKKISIDFNSLYSAFLDFLQSPDFTAFLLPPKGKLLLHRINKNGSITVRREKSFALHTINKSKLRLLYKELPALDQLSNPEEEVGRLVKGVNVRALLIIYSHLKGFEGQYFEQLIQQEEALEPDDMLIQHYQMGTYTKIASEQSPRYVLIIDEINRANIAHVFGDLISLIEPDKRDGQSEALSAMLPYSKTYLTVPANLHLIATMNTADRSIDTLDVALRRRFTFIEMSPEPSLLKGREAFVRSTGIHLELLLRSINLRIERLLGRDYCLGHSYFMRIKDLEDLKEVFRYRVLPLLQEYFFNDYSKIGLILGKAFVTEQRFDPTRVFADFDDEYAAELADKKVYHLRPIEELTATDFIEIYQNNP